MVQQRSSSNGTMIATVIQYSRLTKSGTQKWQLCCLCKQCTRSQIFNVIISFVHSIYSTQYTHQQTKTKNRFRYFCGIVGVLLIIYLLDFKYPDFSFVCLLCSALLCVCVSPRYIFIFFYDFATFTFHFIPFRSHCMNRARARAHAIHHWPNRYTHVH